MNKLMARYRAEGEEAFELQLCRKTVEPRGVQSEVVIVPGCGPCGGHHARFLGCYPGRRLRTVGSCCRYFSSAGSHCPRRLAVGARLTAAWRRRLVHRPGPGGARPGELASLLLDSHGVTGAQARVVALVLRGYSAKQIGSQLAISQDTIQEHLRAVFDELGVRSRQELAAAVMRPS